MNCCENKKIVSFGGSEWIHFYCKSCKSHEYEGRFYTHKEWEMWVNSKDEEDQRIVKTVKRNSAGFVGIVRHSDDMFTAMTFSASKNFKTFQGADNWLKSKGY